MNRRQAKKIMRSRDRGRGYVEARASWERDLADDERRQGRWSPVNRERLRAHVTPGEMRLWWLSFVDPDRPAGGKFLGACQVWADCGHNAIGEAYRLGCNPGGEVQFMAASPAAAAKLVMIVRDRDTGVRLYCETTLRLFLAAADVLRIRYAEELKDPNP